MNRQILLLALSAALVPGLAMAEETTVYKTKNADGTTTYSQIQSNNAEARSMESRDPALPPAGEKPKTEVEVACERAQANLAAIGSGKTLQRDKDGDGKPETLTPDEVASEKDLAERQKTLYCVAPAQD